MYMSEPFGEIYHELYSRDLQHSDRDSLYKLFDAFGPDNMTPRINCIEKL